MVRCYGRLRNSTLQQETKTPVLIAPNTKMAQPLIQEAHSCRHCSTAHVVSKEILYSTPKLRQQVKNFIRTCVNCQRLSKLLYRYPDTAILQIQEYAEKKEKKKGCLNTLQRLDYYGLMQMKEEGMSKLWFHNDVYNETPHSFRTCEEQHHEVLRKRYEKIHSQKRSLEIDYQR